jgi:hypothetical protein
MAEAIDECVRIVDDARSQMDSIDQQAHDAIRRVVDGQKGGPFGPWVTLATSWAILVKARLRPKRSRIRLLATPQRRLGRLKGKPHGRRRHLRYHHLNSPSMVRTSRFAKRLAR